MISTKTAKVFRSGMNSRMLVPVALSRPTALRSKKYRGKNVTAAGWRGYVNGSKDKLSDTD